LYGNRKNRVVVFVIGLIGFFNPLCLVERARVYGGALVYSSSFFITNLGGRIFNPDFFKLLPTKMAGGDGGMRGDLFCRFLLVATMFKLCKESLVKTA
jgi:hypothetical protein